MIDRILVWIAGALLIGFLGLMAVAVPCDPNNPAPVCANWLEPKP